MGKSSLLAAGLLASTKVTDRYVVVAAHHLEPIREAVARASVPSGAGASSMESPAPASDVAPAPPAPSPGAKQRLVLLAIDHIERTLAYMSDDVRAAYINDIQRSSTKKKSRSSS